MTPPRARRPRAEATGLPWDRAAEAFRASRAAPDARPPVVLVTGAETLLVDRAVEAVLRAARWPGGDPRLDAVGEPTDPGAPLDETQLDARDYAPGALAVLASPSLFEEPRAVVLRNLHEGVDEAILETQAYLAYPQQDVVLVLQHGGGVKARKLLDQAREQAAVVVDCAPVRSDADLLAFVGSEFRDARRTVVNEAAQALVDAFGSDLRELASACRQLMADTVGDVDRAQVLRYYGGRAEATGFEVADAVVARSADEALLQLRRALDSGVAAIPLVAVIALKMRQMAKVAAARGRGPEVAKELGMAPWMVDKARRDLRQWSPTDLSAAIVALAEADTSLKGGLLRGGVPRGVSQDDVYTVERLVLAITGPGVPAP